MPMRKALKQLNGERRRFVGVFVRFGEKKAWKGSTLTTILLKDICDGASGKLMSDHLWFNLTKEFANLTLKEGVCVSFDARVKSYYKGYQGYREDVDKPVERDFRLANPTKVKIVTHNPAQEGLWKKVEFEHE